MRRDGDVVLLQPEEFRLLEELMRHAGEYVTRTMLLERVWDFHFGPQKKILEPHVSRLARIETTAGAIAAGDLSGRMTVGPRHDEFDRVAASLNAMLERIANLRQVTSDPAHDLRTPLMRLRNQLDALHEPDES